MSHPLNIIISLRSQDLLGESEGWQVVDDPKLFITELRTNFEKFQEALIVFDESFLEVEKYIGEIREIFMSPRRPPRILRARDPSSLAVEIQKYYEEDGWKKHPAIFRDLLLERKNDLLRLKEKLQGKLEKKQKLAEENQKKIFSTSQRQFLIKKCLIAIQEADSPEKIEEQFLRHLASSFELSWVKILPRPHDEVFCKDLEVRLPASFLRLPLFGGSSEFGSIIFVKINQIIFSKEQISFLKQLSEAVSMAMVRLKNFEHIVDIQAQWEATFQAIPFPFLITDSNYEIIQSNQWNNGPVQKKCFEVLFQRSSPCVNCQRGKKFILDTGAKAFEVLSQEIANEEQTMKTYVNAYVDITEKNRIQKKILENSKLAEIGLIGGSIAHEINNPLSGLLSYIQLIRMDLPSNDSRMSDIIELEKATQRCIEIVKKLLEASRDSSRV
jgi:hypothetical protein